MSIDYDAVLDKFIDVARQALNGKLSTIGPTGTEYPSVIRARQGGNLPDFPYCTVDYLITDGNNEWLLQDYITDNGDLVYESTKTLVLNYRVYGGSAMSIANDLHGYFRVERVRDSIRQATGGAVTVVDAIDSLPNVLPDAWRESASFNVTFSIVDTLIIPDEGENYITSIVLDGELKDGEGDTDPLPINVNAP